MTTPFALPDGFFDERGSRELRLHGRPGVLVASSKRYGRRIPDIDGRRFGVLGINLVLRGRGRYVEPDGRTHDLLPGTLFQRYPRAPSPTWFDPESDFAECFLVFDEATGTQLIALGLLPSAPVVDVGVDRVIVEEFRHLIKRLRMPESQASSCAVLLEAIAFISGLHERASRNRARDPWDKAVDDACLLLGHNLDERVRIEVIAEQVGVSYAAFRKHFKQATGYSPADYRIRRRLEAAQRALATSSVADIARDLGYGDPYAFSTQFKAFLGMSPRAFLRRSRRPAALVPLIRPPS